MTPARNRFTALTRAIAIGFIVSACSSGSRITPVYEDPAFSGISYRNILVVAATQNYENRAAYERVMSTRLVSSGVAAAPLHQIGGGNRPVDRDVIIEAVRAGGFDAVLYTHTVGSQSSFSTTTGQTTVGANRKSDRVVNLFRYDYEEHADPEYVSLATSAVLITELYAVSSKSKVWEARTDLAERDSPALLIEDAVSLLMGALQRGKLLSTVASAPAD
jgi:hypothetical protein